MTIPQNILFPEPRDDQDERAYSLELVKTLETMYQDMANAINGDIRGDAFGGKEKWTPTLNGSTNGSFTYTTQTGWVLRKGLFVDIWFELVWDGTAASGDLYVELPYKVANSDSEPFIGPLSPSGITFDGGSYLFITAVPNTYRGEIMYAGSGITSAEQQVSATGAICGHLRYLGVQIETG